MLNFIKNLSWPEILLIALVVIAFFGSKRIVDLSRRLGSTTKDLTKIKQDLKNIKEEVA